MSEPSQRRNGIIGAAFREPLLSPEEERALARRVRATGDPAARDRLMRSHLRLVARVAARYRSREVPFDDLFSEGVIGLIKAADRFDPERGVRFATYARWWVRAQIAHCLERSRPPAEDEGRPARDAGADAWLRRQEVAGDVLDRLADPADGPEAIVGRQEERAVHGRLLAEALGRLTERERYIVTVRRLRERPLTFAELGRAIGVSQERVRQIDLIACRKLREACRSSIAHAA